MKTRLLLGLAALLLSSLAPAPASAEFGIAPGSFSSQLLGADALNPELQAGAHPASQRTDLSLNVVSDPYGFTHPDGTVKNIAVALPSGFFGNPEATPKCPRALFALFGTSGAYCPPATQVGTAQLFLDTGFGPSEFDAAVYNILPRTGDVADFGMVIVPGAAGVHLIASLRADGDFGVNAHATDISTVNPLFTSTVTLWGVPADHNGAGGLRRAFLTNPSACSGPLTSTLEVDSWQNPGVFDTATATMPGMTGCDKVPFEPELSVQPQSHAADTPTGLDVDLHVPQNEDPDVIATSPLKKAVVTLPQGMSVNPASADGLGSCSPQQIGLSTAEGETPIHFDQSPVACPDSSKIGSAELHTPLLAEGLTGSVYLAKQGDNPFHSLLSLYLVLENEERGLLFKFAGKVTADPQIGQLTTTFDENPQLPFEDLELHLKGGPRAPLRTPATCGTFTTTSELSPWSGNPASTPSDSFQISSGPNGGPCASSAAARPFAPMLNAGVVNPLGGARSPFDTQVKRADGEKELTSLTVKAPQGLAAVLRGVPYCTEAAIAASAARSGEGEGSIELAHPSCPAASQVGSVLAGAGAGPSPFYVTGKAYLAGPYKGAPLSLAVITPAVAGPFDLGTVVIRAALRVDPESAQVTAVSDPIPTALHGIPLDLRDLRVNLDRPDFVTSPTGCDPMSIDAGFGGAEGASAAASVHFQLGSCERLAFRPHLSLRLKGGTRRAENPALRATLTMPAKTHNANVARAQVTLPHSEFLDQAHIGTICTRVQFAADACPAGSVYGHARAFTPLLDQPLEGPVYLRSSNNPLPDLVADLRGQIHIVLDGRIDSKDGGIRTTFAQVPDAPVSKFVLAMKGGKKGLLENHTDLCRGTHRATVRMDAHNGKLSDSRPELRAACGGGKRRRR